MEHKVQASGTQIRPDKIPKYEPGMAFGPSGYHGHPPDGGTSYGFSCGKCKRQIYSTEGAKYCPHCKALLKPKKGKEEVRATNVVVGECPTCKDIIVASSTDVGNKLYCTYCGTLNNRMVIYARKIGESNMKEIIADLKARAAKADTEEDRQELMQMAAELESQDKDSKSESTSAFDSEGNTVKAAALLIEHGRKNVVITANDDDTYDISAEDDTGGVETYKDKDGDTFSVDTPGKQVLKKQGVKAEADDEDVVVDDDEEAEGESDEDEEGESADDIKEELSEFGDEEGGDDEGDDKGDEDEAEGCKVKAEGDEESSDEEDDDDAVEGEGKEDEEDGPDDPEIMDVISAQRKVKKLNDSGIDAKVVRVVKGYVVTAADEDEGEDDAGEDEVLDEEEADSAISHITARGKKAVVTRVVKGWVVKAEEGDDDESDEEDEEEADGVLNEKQTSAEIDRILATGAKAEVTRVIGGFVVKAAVEEDPSVELKAAVTEINALNKQGKDAVVTRTLTGYVVKAEDEEGEEDEDEVDSSKTCGEDEDEGDDEELEAVTNQDYENQDNVPDEKKIEEQAGLQYELLSGPSSWKELHSSDFTMLLEAESDKGPFYNVLIKGQPVARVELQAQPNPDQYKNLFPKEDYAVSLVDAMVKFGVYKTLKNVNAKFYANEKGDDLKESIAMEVVSKYQKEYAEMVANLRDDFLDRINMVIAGLSKNFWNTEITNHLKAALFNKMAEHGINGASEIIEAAFDEGAAPFFATVLDKAGKYLDATPESLAEIKEAVMGAATLPVEDDTLQRGDGTSKTFAEYLSQNNVPINPASFGSDGTSDYQKMKEEVKSKIQLRRRY